MHFLVEPTYIQSDHYLREVRLEIWMTLDETHISIWKPMKHAVWEISKH